MTLFPNKFTSRCIGSQESTIFGGKLGTQLITYPITCSEIYRDLEGQLEKPGNQRKRVLLRFLICFPQFHLTFNQCSINKHWRNFATRKMDPYVSLFLSYPKQLIVSIWRNQGSLCPLLPVFLSQKVSLSLIYSHQPLTRQ